MTRLRVLVALVVALVPVAAAAQTPVVFVHGLKSNGGTWREAADRLSSRFAIQPYRPDLSWSRTYTEQADELERLNRNLPGSTIVVGHSNGGIVAREWSRHHPVAGVVTIGTPHIGAPLIGNLPAFFGYVDFIINNLFMARNGLAALQWHQPEGDWWVMEFETAIDMEVLEAVRGDMVTGLTAAGLYATEALVPVLQDMQPASAYRQDINSSSNLAREASAIPSRIGIVATAPGFGGIARAIAPDQARAFGDVERLLAGWLAIRAGDVLMLAGAPDDRAMLTASRLMTAATSLWFLDDVWCYAVSVPLPYTDCRPNDGVVPAWSQQYPGALMLETPTADGYEHNNETTEAAHWVERALAENFSLPAAGSVPPPPPPPPPPLPPPTGPAMQQDAAIRNCWDYSDWGATYQESPDACSNYCAANGADACEWEASSGGCWVEFGSGCDVVNGFGGWYAATLYSPERPKVRYIPAAVGLAQLLLIVGAGLARRRGRDRCRDISR